MNCFPRAQSALSYLLYSPRRKTFSCTNAKENCFCDKETKIFLFMLIQCQIISILLCRGLSKLIINGKSGRNMEVIRLYTTQVMPALEPVNFLSVKNMLEEGLLEDDHITLNTTAYCVTKQQIDNRKFQFMSRRKSY